MTSQIKAGRAKPTRRDALKGAGALMFGLTSAGGMTVSIVPDVLAQGAPKLPPGPSPDSIDTWLRISRDGRFTVFTGKVDHGQGLDTAYAQIVAEELDVSVDRVSVVMGHTDDTPNQGGASASTGIRTGANPLRHAAAEARRMLVETAAQRLGGAPGSIVVRDGTAFLKGASRQRVRYEDLFGDKPIGTKLEWNGQVGNGMDAKGRATPKPREQHRIVGTPVRRRDIPKKVLGTEDYLTNVRVPGMLHGRMVRPAVSGAVPVKVDASSVARIPGVMIVHKRDFLGVVAPREYDAVLAARLLAVEWSRPSTAWPGHDGIFEHIRKAPVAAQLAVNAFYGKKDVDEKPALDALKSAARVIEADYECAFQSHARMGPSVGIADVRKDSATIWSDTQKPHFHREGLAKLLGLPLDKVRVVWKHGAGSYGRSDADEAPFEAAVMSQEIGRPVRVQWNREEGTAWDPKAPAAVVSCKAGLDTKGDLNAWWFRAKGFSGWDVKWFADAPEQTLAGQQLGHKKWNMHNFDVPTESYQFPNAAKFWQTVAPLQEQVSPMRCAHTRAPQEVQTRFAQECFIDEVAAATGQDPVALRLKLLKDEREIAVLKAVAERARWSAADAKPRGGSGNIRVGRGVALMSGYGSYAALVAEVEVNRSTGRVWCRKMTVAHDCGMIINPSSLKLVIEGNVVQGLSRALLEEVEFDERRVKSVDWESYQILSMRDVPREIDIVMLKRPDKPPGGAGEPSLVPVPAVIGNAIFNATGVRMRRYPFLPARVKKALA
jgi:nicotinate dehydrogenase subunit B